MEEFEDFNIDLSEYDGEQEGYVLQPKTAEEGYVQDVYLAKLPEIKDFKNNEGIMLSLEFMTKDGGRFTHNILNPIVPKETNKSAEITASNISRIKHIFSALIPSPYITKVQANGKKAKVKAELDNFKFTSLREFFEHLVRIVPADALQIPSTIKLVSKEGRIKFPDFPICFIANAWNGKDPKKDFVWNPDYDFVTSSKPKNGSGGSSAPKPDIESGEIQYA